MSIRPRYNSAEKDRNRAFLIAHRGEIAAVARIVEHTDVHWTLHFENGREVHLYPTKIGLHRPGRWLRYFDLTSILGEIQRLSRLPAVEGARS